MSQSQLPTPAGPIEMMTALRMRAWQMLVDLATPPDPFFESAEWVHEEDAFAAPGPPARPDGRATVFAMPEELFEPDEDRVFAASDDFKIYEATFYNRAAVRHVRRAHLYDRLTTLVLVEQKRREIDEFPPEARIIKTFWRPIPIGGCASVGVWKWKFPDPDDAEKRIPESQWRVHTKLDPIRVAADDDPQSGCGSASSFITTKVTATSIF